MGFEEFMRLTLRLAVSTVENTVSRIRKFLREAKYVVSYPSICKYLKSYLDNAAATYNAELKALRRFIREYLGHPELVVSFKMAPVEESMENPPTKAQVRKGFHGQRDSRAKSVYLFFATAGLRKGEVLGLTKDRINFKLRAVTPNHFTRNKRSGVTFYNGETEEWIMKYLNGRIDWNPKVFVISDRAWRTIWMDATEKAGVKITAKVLRAWFSTEMGELGVPDRYVDVFQGRVPRSVLAKHYTGKGLERLKRIYDKAGLKVLS